MSYWATVEIQWKTTKEIQIQDVYVMENRKLYEELCLTDGFDPRIWFNFADTKEFESYFSEDNDDEWFIVREIDNDER